MSWDWWLTADNITAQVIAIIQAYKGDDLFPLISGNEQFIEQYTPISADEVSVL